MPRNNTRLKEIGKRRNDPRWPSPEREAGKYTRIPIMYGPEGGFYGKELRIINPTKKSPERIEYRMNRSATNLPRVKIDIENGTDQLIEFLLDTGATGSLIRRDAIRKLGVKGINRTERIKYIGVANSGGRSAG